MGSDVTDNSWQEASFRDTQNRTNSGEPGKVLDKTQTHSHDTPCDSENGQPYLRRNLLQDQIAGNLATRNS